MRRRRSESDSWLAMDLPSWTVADSRGASIPLEVRRATKIPGRDDVGLTLWPRSVLLYQYGEFNLLIGVDDILMAEPKGYPSGESLDLVLAPISAIPTCPVFSLMHLTGHLLQLGQFPKVDIPANRDIVVVSSNPNNQHWLLVSASRVTRRISGRDRLTGQTVPTVLINNFAAWLDTKW